MIARKIGEEKFKKFIQDTKLLTKPDIQLEEVGKPIKFKWNKCKLETVSMDMELQQHLQATTIYA